MNAMLSLEAAKRKTVYVDDTTAGIPNAVFFMRSLPFSQYEDKEKAVAERFDAIVKSYLTYGDLWHKRFADEMQYERDKYLEIIGKEFDFLKDKKIVLESDLPDDDNSILVFAKSKPTADYGRSIVLRRAKLNDTKLPYIVYARRGDSVYAWSSNKEDLSLGEVGGKALNNSEDLPYPVLSADYEPSEDDELSLCVLNAKQVARFRQLFTHKFSGSGASKGVALLINGCIAGIMGYESVFGDLFGALEENELMLQFCIAVTIKDKNAKIGRLLSMVSLWNKCLGVVLSDYDRERYTRVVTASVSPYPENKVMRRTMTLKSKRYDAKSGMYTLLYGADVTHQRDLKEIFKEWLGAMKRSNDNRRKQDANSK